MKIDDLDLRPGVADALFQTRRMLVKANSVSRLEEMLASVKLRRTELEKSRMTTLHRCAELVGMCQSGLKLQGDMTNTLNRMIALIGEEQRF